MRNKIFFSVVGMFFLIFSINSCTRDTTGTVKINFDYKVGNKPLELNSFSYEMPSGYEYMIVVNKYFVSKINLLKEDGGSVEIAKVHYRDADQDDTKILTIEDVPAGEYTNISFTFGLDEEDNDQFNVPNTVNSQNMFWPIPYTCEGYGIGYHYMKLDGRYKRLDTIKSYNTHLGPTNVDNSKPNCNDNSFIVTLPFDSSMKLDGNTLNIDLVHDLLEWYQNPNIYDFEKYGQDIMPQQEAQIELKANGHSVFSLGNVSVN